MSDLTLIATVTIFIATYAVVAVGKVPVYRIDRAGAALLGGSLMLAIGVLNALWCLFDRPWRQCWHDKAARTFVASNSR